MYYDQYISVLREVLRGLLRDVQDRMRLIIIIYNFSILNLIFHANLIYL